MTSLHLLRRSGVAVLLGLWGCAGSRPEASAGAPAAARADSDRVSDTPAATSQPASTDSVSEPDKWFTVDSAAKSVTLELEVTGPEGAPSALINGHRAGDLKIVVPVNWTVNWNWRNADPGSPHSLVVMVQREKIPTEGGRPSFSNALTRMATEGLPAGQTDRTTFQAEEAGWYWMLCGVPGHALKGEWIELRVDPEAKTADKNVKREA